METVSPEMQSNMAILQSYDSNSYKQKKTLYYFMCFFPSVVAEKMAVQWSKHFSSLLQKSETKRATEFTKNIKKYLFVYRITESESRDITHTPPWSWVSLGYS